MNFSCSRCQTRYQIADEKVRGKILQIRCKSCQNVIEVRDPDANAALGLSAPPTSTMSMLGIAALNLEGSLEQSGARPPNPVSQVPGARPVSPMLSRPMTSSMPALPKAPPPAPSVKPPPPPAPKSPSPIVPPSTPRPVMTGTRPALAPSSPEPVAAEVAEWWYAEGSERRGPCSMRKLGDLLQGGSLPVDSLVWKPSLAEWKPAKDVAELRSFLPKPKEPSPVVAPPIAAPAILQQPVATVPQSLAIPSPQSVVQVPQPTIAPPQPTPTAAQLVTPSSLAAANRPTVPPPSAASSEPVASVATESAPVLQFHSATPQKDIFANFSDVSGTPVPVSEGSALIPLSAGVQESKPTQKPWMMIASHVVVAALFFFVGYASRTAQVIAPEEQAALNCPPPGANMPTPVYSDSQIKALGGANTLQNGNVGVQPNTPKGVVSTNNGRPVTTDNTQAQPISPDQSQNLSLFGNKSSVTPNTPLANTKSNTGSAALPGADVEAAKVIAESEAGSKRCIERALASGDIKKETRLEVSIQTNAQGKVTSVGIKNSPLTSLENCLKNHYSRLSFVKSGEVTMTFSLIASPSF